MTDHPIAPTPTPAAPGRPAIPRRSVLKAGAAALAGLGLLMEGNSRIGNFVNQALVGWGLIHAEPATETRQLTMNYGRIGWRAGPDAAPEIRQSVRDFWVGRGGEGARWLANRVRTEFHGDTLDGVANLLADIGGESVGPITEVLNADPSRDQAEVLLKALGWIEAPSRVREFPSSTLEGILEKYLENPDPDIRAATLEATRILPISRASRLIAGRREIETDSDVIESIGLAQELTPDNCNFVH